MKRVTNIVAAAGAGLLMSLPAFAGDQLSLSDLREKCTEILGNPQMVKPQVSVACDQTQFKWVATTSSFNLQDTTQVHASIGMKTWEVDNNFPASTPAQFGCQTLVQHKIYVTPVTESIDCEQILKELNTDQDLSNLCGSLLQNRIGEDPSLVQDTLTGQTLNTCSSQQGQQAQQGQQQGQQAVQQQGPQGQQQGQQGQAQGQQGQQVGQQQGQQQGPQGQQAGQPGGQQASTSQDTSADGTFGY